MMRFIYDENRKKLIINHENTMFKTYTEIIGKYSALFKQYECDLKISISWRDVYKRQVISTTSCLWFGMQEIIQTRFPHQIAVEVNDTLMSVSYTHLDVYKRQCQRRPGSSARREREQHPYD